MDNEEEQLSDARARARRRVPTLSLELDRATPTGEEIASISYTKRSTVGLLHWFSRYGCIAAGGRKVRGV
eukprot:3444412-Prymnesium_polylepis.1